jgi:hypothetical protein
MMRLVSGFSLAVLLASSALAAPPDPRSDSAIVAAVQREFVAPYVAWQKKRSEFSRAAMPPSETRVRVLGEPHKDAQGAEFVPFAVDTRYGEGEWIEAQMTGCVYVASSAVYVKRGGGLRAAAEYFAHEIRKLASAVCAP